MIAAVFAPVIVLDQLFAEPPSDAVSLALTRHWGLVFCFGGLLVGNAYRPEIRKPVLVFTILLRKHLLRGITFGAIRK